MPVHAVAVKRDSNSIDDTFEKASRINDAEGIYSLMGKLPKDFQDRWIWIACRKAGWKGAKPTVAEMTTALRDDAEPERAQWFERAFAGFKGKALKSGKGLTRAADEHADKVADWIEAQRVKAALRDVAVAAADFARAVMPGKSHTAHPERLGCKLMTESSEAIRIRARSIAVEEAEILATIGAGEGNLTLGGSLKKPPLFCHSECRTCLKTGIWHNAGPHAEMAVLSHFHDRAGVAQW